MPWRWRVSIAAAYFGGTRSATGEDAVLVGGVGVGLGEEGDPVAEADVVGAESGGVGEAGPEGVAVLEVAVVEGLLAGGGLEGAVHDGDHPGAGVVAHTRAAGWV